MHFTPTPQRASLALIIILLFCSVVCAQDRRQTDAARRHSATRPIANTSSPFEPPKPNDYTFVINSGAGLDTGCSYRSDGPLIITLPINRVLGDLAKLQANGLVGRKLRVEFPAFDVDSGAPGTPERDRVSINGHVVPGEFTTGINDRWIMQRFDIEVDWLLFPADPGPSGTLTPKDNVIRIDIDTASGTDENWCTAVDWVTFTLDNPIPPRPWIGAHGIFSQNGIWDFWVDRIQDYGIPAGLGPSMGNLDTIGSNAGKIGNAVEQARERWGVDRVNIVAHSKGGLDSRHYVENSETVEKLVQLGTPNAGSALADYIEAGSIILLEGQGSIIANNLLGGFGGYQLTRPYMAVYNFFHGSNPKVTYMAIAGVHTPGDWSEDADGRFLQALVGEGDLIVPLTSVHALPYTFNQRVDSAYPPPYGDAWHVKLHHNGEAFAKARFLVTAPGLKSLESRPTLSSSGTKSLKGVNAASADPALQHTQTFGGKLQQGQTATHVVAVDSASALAFTLLYPQGRLELKLTDPNGHLFDATTVAGRTDVSVRETDIPGGRLVTYGFDGPFTAGDWTVAVTAHEAAAQVGYNVVAWLENAPLRMASTLDRLSAPVGGSFTLTAILSNGTSPVTGASVRANVRLPDGVTTRHVVLADDGLAPDATAGDGVYAGRFSGTTQPGAYGIAISASGNASGKPFARESYLSSFVSASTSTIQGGLSDFGRDLNGNGLFDQLVLRVPVQITAGGAYRFAATLTDSAGNVLETSKSFELTTASNNVELVFDGATLFAHGVNGPYHITSVRMAEERNQTILPLMETASTFDTAPYSFRQFEGGSLALTGSNSAVGVDTNGNGKFDILRADIGVNVRNAGSYQWTARLRDRNGREVTLAGGSGTLTAGVNSIRLSFDGATIGRNGVNGPFNITDLLLFSSTDTLSAANVFATPPLPASSFEGYVAPPVTIQFGSGTYNVSEQQHTVALTLTRGGVTTGAVAVNYRTVDGTASARSDYQTALGTLRFAPGEVTKTINVLITDDAYVESDETFSIVLSDPIGGSALGAPDTAVVTIVSNDTSANAPNPIDGSEFFVRQHYHDFLRREPDPAGLAFWVNEIESCGADAACREARRIMVSAAFFLSIEFQEAEYFVVRAQRAAFGRQSAAPSTRLSYEQVVRDTTEVGEGVIVGQAGFEQRLEANKQAYAEKVVSAPDFLSRFPATQTAAQYVDALYQSAGVAPTAAERQEAVNAFGGGATPGRVAAFRRVADSDSVRQAEFHPAFVLAEYFSYLRRDPDTPGYDYWLAKLNQFNGDFVRAEMVKAFITSAEYRQRFGPPLTQP